MSLLGLLEKRSTLANPSGFLLNMFGGRATESGTSVSEQTALTHGPVYACIQVIAEAIATLPCNLYRRRDDGGQDLVTDMAISSFFNQTPNDEMIASSFKATQLGWVLSWGNGFAEIERNNGGEAIAVHPLAPVRIVPRRRTPDWRIEYYLAQQNVISPYSLEQVVVDPDPIDRDDMLHFAGFGYDGIMGYSPIAMMREEIGLGISLRAYGARFFGNSGVPSGILESPKQIKDPAKLKKAWQAANGAGNQRGTAVLEDGVTYKNIGIPPEDSQFLQTRGYSKKEICALYRVPPHMVADLERSTNNNIEHQGKEFVTYCLMSHLVRFEQECGRKLLSPAQVKAGYFYAFDVDELLRGDTAARYASYAIGRQWGFLCANDVRRRERMNALPDEQGEIFLVPMNMVNAEEVANPPDPPEPAPAPFGANPLLPGPATNLAADPALPVPTKDDPSEDLDSDSDRALDLTKVKASFRALFADAAGRAVRKEMLVVARAARKPAGFAAAMTEFYRTHADTLTGAILPAAATFAELRGVPFITVRALVQKIAREHAARAMTELAAPSADLQKFAETWQRDRPGEIAEQLLKGMRL